MRVAVVEHLDKSRQPMPTTPAIYFIRPTQKSVNRLLEVWVGDLRVLVTPLFLVIQNLWPQLGNESVEYVMSTHILGMSTSHNV